MQIITQKDLLFPVSWMSERYFHQRILVCRCDDSTGFYIVVSHTVYLPSVLSFYSWRLWLERLFWLNNKAHNYLPKLLDLSKLLGYSKLISFFSSHFLFCVSYLSECHTEMMNSSDISPAVFKFEILESETSRLYLWVWQCKLLPQTVSLL